MDTWLYVQREAERIEQDYDFEPDTWVSFINLEDNYRWVSKKSDWFNWSDTLNIPTKIEFEGTKGELIEWLSGKQFELLWPLS